MKNPLNPKESRRLMKRHIVLMNSCPMIAGLNEPSRELHLLLMDSKRSFGLFQSEPSQNGNAKATSLRLFVDLRACELSCATQGVYIN